MHDNKWTEQEIKELVEHAHPNDLSNIHVGFRELYISMAKNEDKLPVETLTKIALYDEYSGIRYEAVRLLDKRGALTKEASNRLSHDENAEIRIIAAKKADSSNYFEEKDPYVARTLIKKRLVSEECRHHWYEDPVLSRKFLEPLFKLLRLE